MRVVTWRERNQLQIPHGAEWLQIIVDLEEFKNADLYLLPHRDKLIINDRAKTSSISTYHIGQRFDSKQHVLYKREHQLFYMIRATIDPDSIMEFDHIVLNSVQMKQKIPIKCRLLELSNVRDDDAKLIFASAAQHVVEIRTLQWTRNLLRQYTCPNLIDAGPNMFDQKDNFVDCAFRFPKLSLVGGTYHGWKDAHEASPDWLFNHTQAFLRQRFYATRLVVQFGLKNQLGHDVAKMIAKMIRRRDVSMEGYQDYLDAESVALPRGVTRQIYEENQRMRKLMSDLPLFQKQVETSQLRAEEASMELELNRKRLRDTVEEIEAIINKKR